MAYLLIFIFIELNDGKADTQLIVLLAFFSVVMDGLIYTALMKYIFFT